MNEFGDQRIGWRVRAMCEHLDAHPKSKAVELMAPLNLDLSRKVGVTARQALKHGLIEHSGGNPRNTENRREYSAAPGWREKLGDIDAARKKPEAKKPVARVNSVWQLGAV